MRQILVSEELLRQAIEAFELHAKQYPHMVKGYTLDAATALRAALEQAPVQEQQCNPHPKAPHGFDRNASHSSHRYVCDCESWEPYDAGYNDGFQAGLKAEPAPVQEPVHRLI